MSAGLWAMVMNAVPWAVGVAYVAAVVIAYVVGRTRGESDATVSAVAHAASLSAAFNRGVDAGEHRAAVREREKRSAAGTKAAATRRANEAGVVTGRNRVTGETPQSLDDLRGSVPDLTGGLSSEEFVRRQREGWDESDADAPGRAD